MKITIPFTLPSLNEYIEAERSHKQAGAGFKRRWQSAVILVLKKQIKRPLQEPVVMHYTWIEKDRRRDKDNISGYGRKVIQDALVKMHALKNDGWANVDGFTDTFKVDKKHPRIEIKIEEEKL